MLTIFAIPKAFKGHVDIIQRNALKSWTLLQPQCEIILCGDDPGVAEVAGDFGAEHLPDIERNKAKVRVSLSDLRHEHGIARAEARRGAR